MKKTLLLLAFAGILNMQAQTTHDLIWQRNFTSPQSDLTIEVGDTVRWTWTDTFPHTVENDSGSTETFDSGLLTGNGQTYSFTFTQEGINPYFCGIHGAGSMSGTITVEPALSVDEFSSKSFIMYPNPATTELNIQFLQNFSEGTISIYDLTGKQVLVKSIDQYAENLFLNISSIKSGLYILQFEFGDNLLTKKLIVK